MSNTEGNLGAGEDRLRRRREPGICVKCRTEKACAYVREAGYCQPCFIHQMTGKVRTHLTRTPLPGDIREVRGKCRVLLAFSGGPSSRVLLDMVAHYTGEHVNQQARRFGEISVVHVDESILEEDENASCSTLRHDIQNVVDSYGMRLSVVALPSAFSTTDDPDGRRGFEKCRQSYSSNGSKSSEEDLVRQIKMHLLRQVALEQGATILLTGDSATRTAIHTLLEITQGRGYTLPFLVGPTSTTGYPDVVVWRPLRDCLAKEMDQYIAFQELQVPKNTEKKEDKSEPTTLYGMTQSFIVGLDEGFPATASTVARTAAKLRVAPEALESSDERISRCVICDLPVQGGSQGWRDRCAILGRSTKADDREKGCGDSSKDAGCCGGSGDSGCNGDRPSNQGTSSSLPMALCYGCRVAASADKGKKEDVERDTPLLWPRYAQHALDQQTKDAKVEGLREQIQDFLLEDEEDQ
ncbi:hypothetical protein BJ684DRAFT_18886 [Piptocephalis cylindrospora]|uniref:Cytoplasmic tRNA 2-thiolation protein 2 n=1 Tax=Piptocephalis cylindrospora TaxID=1907219 RepID=A0A4P9Y6X5_9FUNG|nr:hypothetical protein BJ684DRAFT_18886 [Piptocephalis cylindrospora]|eukprot:RKP14733.1 hypothetical protein BJ684DRAFT_18886 [Piptocephalis cylindrospora]